MGSLSQAIRQNSSDFHLHSSVPAKEGASGESIVAERAVA